MRLLAADTSPELFLWTLNLEPWTPSEPDPSASSSDPTTSSSVRPEPETTGLKATTLRELNSSTLFSTSPERKLRDVTAFKDSKSPTLWEVEQDQEWELFWSQKWERNTPTELWKPSQLCLLLKCQTLSLSLTTPLSPSISWSRTQTSAWWLTTKPSTISASEPSSSPLPPTVTLTTWSQPPCPELLAALGSPVNSTLISESWLSTLFLSLGCTSSWLDLPPSPQEDPNNTEPSPSLNSPNRCSMLRTWCALLILAMEDISLLLPSSEEECQLKKSTNKC